MKAISLFIVIAVLFAAGLVRWSLGAQMSKADTTPVALVQGVDTPRPSEKATATPTPVTKAAVAPLPATAKVNLAFTSQAPFSKWDPLHEDTCEEASLLMVKYLGTTLPTKESVDSTLIDMVGWETDRGYGTSITLQQLNTVASQYFGMKNGQVVSISSLTDIKREIAAGRPVILGMAGKLLANPNFKDGGPVYHMLVVTGYDETGFITNDPGTRLGENFHYDYAGFDAAIHNWDATNILSGTRSMLVFK